MPVLKRYYDVYMRRTATKYASTVVGDSTAIGTSIQEMGTTYTDATKWNLIGLMTAGGVVGMNTGAFVRGEKGDEQALADGSNLVISENIIAEFQSFDVDAVSWGGAATSGAAAALPVRKRFSTNVTGLNVDIAFIDKELGTEIVQNIYVWDVPVHVGINFEAGAIPQFPISISKEVSDLSNYLDVFQAVVDA